MRNKLKVIYSRNPLFEKCPECKKVNTLHRSRPRTVTEKLAKYFSFYKVYRCNSCGWRGYRFLFTFTWDSVKALAFYSAMVIVTFYVVRFFLSKVQQ